MSNSILVHYRTEAVDDVDVFYREAGSPDAPAILLLHGFPSSSHMFRDLMPRLADDYRVIAPDLPGFGSTVVGEASDYRFTFDRLAETIAAFTDAIGLDRFALYVFDYGAPVGFRIAAAQPERITAIVTQNGNAYDEGLTDAWAPIRAYWETSSTENRDALRPLLAPDTTRWQYTEGVPAELQSRVSPDAPAHDQAILDRDNELQLDLFLDYRSNVARYPEWQAYLRTQRPPVLAIWGQNDPFFGPAGAEAFRRDVPDAEVAFLDTGHFALETHGVEIADRIRRFLANALN
ncbi:MAG: alpha/beta hydrolase [Pseudomonadota bacterium]